MAKQSADVRESPSTTLLQRSSVRRRAERVEPGGLASGVTQGVHWLSGPDRVSERLERPGPRAIALPLDRAAWVPRGARRSRECDALLPPTIPAESRRLLRQPPIPREHRVLRSRAMTS